MRLITKTVNISHSHLRRKLSNYLVDNIFCPDPHMVGNLLPDVHVHAIGHPAISGEISEWGEVHIADANWS